MKPSCYVLKGCEACDMVTPHKPLGEPLAPEWRCMECRAKDLVAGQRSASEARQQGFLELAHDLAEMEPAARDAAIRRIIDQHDGGK